MNKKTEVNSIYFLTSNPEVRRLKKHYHELTGKHLSGWNWDEFGDMNSYITYLYEMTAKAEAEAAAKETKF